MAHRKINKLVLDFSWHLLTLAIKNTKSYSFVVNAVILN